MAVPRERRGEAIGVAIGAAVFGAQFGPVVGVAAETLGRAPAFLGVATLGLVLAAAARREPRPVAAGDVSRPARALLRDRAFMAAAWLTFAPSLAFGVEEVLVPLRLDDLGASALGIGAVFLVAALTEAVTSPLAGRFADRRGTLPIVRTATLAGAVLIALFWVPEQTLVLALIVVAFAVVAGMLMTPAGKLVSLRVGGRGRRPGVGVRVQQHRLVCGGRARRRGRRSAGAGRRRLAAVLPLRGAPAGVRAWPRCDCR